MKKLSVIIPAFNEERTLAEIIRRVQAIDVSPLSVEVIVVDNNSTDDTFGIANAIPGICVLQEKFPGKGAAVKKGFRAATGDICLIQDGDLEYDPRDYPQIIKPILDGCAEAVIGVRTLGPKNSKWGIAYTFGKTLITFTTNVLYGNSALEYCGCYKAFTTRLVDSIAVSSNGFDYEHELVAKILKKGYKVIDVPIHHYPRSYEEGKKIRWKDGFAILFSVIKYRFMD